MFGLGGRVALITGGSRGIGWAAAEAMGQAGAKLALNGRDADRLDARVRELKERGIEALALPFDSLDEAAMTAGVAKAAAHFGRLDIVFNNAGHTLRHATPGLSAAEFSRHVELHVTTAFVLAREAVKVMAPQRHGRIVLMGSIMALAPRPGIPAYVAGKSAVSGLAKALAAEFGKDGVTCNAVAPGFIKTDLTAPLHDDKEFNAMVTSRTPAARWGMPVEIAAGVLFLASDEAGYVNGHTLVIDGGTTARL